MTSAGNRRSLVARVTETAVARPALFLGVALALAAVSLWAASHLEIRSSFQELLPEGLPSVQHVKELIRRVGGDGTVLVVVQSLEGPRGLEGAEAMASRLARAFLGMGPAQIRFVTWNMLPVERWYEAHWPLFVEMKDLRKALDAVREEIRKRKLEANPLAMALDDEQGQPAWADPGVPLPREQIARRFTRYPDGYLVHPDHTSVTVEVRPAGTSLSVDEARALVGRMRSIVEAFGPELRDRNLRVGFAGTFPLFVAEYQAIIHGLAGTAVLVITLVLLSILLFFRDLRSTLSLGIPVLIAVALCFGLTWPVIGYLNTQTAFLGAIVVGNGINYGLIYLARVRQLRSRDVALREACVEGALTTARATLLASAATSVSFGVLVIAANRGFRHFGFIGGVGMLLCWLCTFALVPAMLSIFEMLRGAPKKPPRPEGALLFTGLQRFFAHPRAIVGVFAVLCVAAAILFLRQLPRAMERNLENLANDPPRGEKVLNETQARADASLEKSISGAIALLDSREDADRFCEVIRQRIQEKPYSDLIESCETVSSVVPRDQEAKLLLIHEIVAELPDSRLAKVSDPLQRKRLREVRDQLAEQRPVTAQEAPPGLADRFRERDGTLGRLAVLTATHLAHTEMAENLESFVRGVRNVVIDGKSYEATGENVIVADLLADIEKEGPLTTLLSFAGVFALVFIFFRNLRTSAEVAGSLLVGVVLMCGVAAAVGLKINFFNFIVFPVTFGIAVDYSANVAARVRARGGDVLGALAEVGPAVALCSWTSIVGYGSLLYSLNRALRSFGWYAMAGEVTTIVTALVLLPALLLLPRRRASAPALFASEEGTGRAPNPVRPGS